MLQKEAPLLIVDRILGRADAATRAGRSIERVPVAAAEAGRRRVRLRGDQGTEIAIDLPRQSWLFDGAVLHDDGRRLLIVVRPPEPVMVIALASPTPAAMFRIGHALGNRHSPSELRDDEIVVPVTDTPDLASRPVLALGLEGLRLRFEQRPFAADAPPACGAAAHDHPPQRLEPHMHHTHQDDHAHQPHEHHD